MVCSAAGELVERYFDEAGTSFEAEQPDEAAHCHRLLHE